MRIVWGASSVDYYVDGALVASHPIAIAAPMYVYASNNGPAALGLDFLRVGVLHGRLGGLRLLDQGRRRARRLGQLSWTRPGAGRDRR